MKLSTMTYFAKQLTILGATLALATPSLAGERTVDVWYDGEGNPRRVTVIQPNGTKALVEIDEEKPKVWKKQLKELGVDISVLGKETLPETEQLGNAHQLMQYRGFDRNALPEGTYFSHGWGNYYNWGYPSYRFPRGGGYYCRPHPPRGGGLIFTF